MKIPAAKNAVTKQNRKGCKYLFDKNIIINT